MRKVFIITINLLITFVSSNLQPPIIDSNFGTKDEKLKAEKQQRYPPCKSCSILADSFNKVKILLNYYFLIPDSYLIAKRQGLEKTQRGKHDGGDAHWEEKKLGSYKTSELRLVEIQETLCTDNSRGEQQCQAIAEEHESDIEFWWKRQEEFPGTSNCPHLMSNNKNSSF